MALKAERRFFKAEVRASDGSSPKISGYVTNFGKLSQVIYDFRERFQAGCFDECLAENPDIVGLFNHNMDYVLGRTTAGTLRASVDDVGLAYEIDPPDTQLARDLVTSMRRGDIRGSSIGFYCLEDTWDLDPSTGGLLRTIVKAAVFDISVVTDPAYLDASANVRSQLPEGDEALRALAAEQRARLTQSASEAEPSSDDDQRRADLLRMLELDSLS